MSSVVVTALLASFLMLGGADKSLFLSSTVESGANRKAFEPPVSLKRENIVFEVARKRPFRVRFGLPELRSTLPLVVYFNSSSLRSSPF